MSKISNTKYVQYPILVDFLISIFSRFNIDFDIYRFQFKYFFSNLIIKNRFLINILRLSMFLKLLRYIDISQYIDIFRYIELLRHKSFSLISIYHLLPFISKYCNFFDISHIFSIYRNFFRYIALFYISQFFCIASFSIYRKFDVC